MVADIQANRLPGSPQPENRQPDNHQPDNHQPDHHQPDNYQSGHDAAKVQTIAVIGAGIMGRGIAHAAALGGYRTILEDLLPNALRKAETEIRANLDKAVELNKVTAADAGAAFKRLEYAGSVEEAAREADLVS